MSHELQNYFVLLGNSGDNAFCVKILFVVEADVGLERFFAVAESDAAGKAVTLRVAYCEVATPSLEPLLCFFTVFLTLIYYRCKETRHLFHGYFKKT